MEIINLAAGKLDCELRGCANSLQVTASRLIWPCTYSPCIGTASTSALWCPTAHVSCWVSIQLTAVFMRDMACGGPYFSKLLLNALFFSVSKFSDRPEVREVQDNDVDMAGATFLRRVKQLLGDALDQSSIPTIQAMLLLSTSLFSMGKYSACWQYLGIALRMIFDLGELAFSVGN